MTRVLLNLTTILLVLILSLFAPVSLIAVEDTPATQDLTRSFHARKNQESALRLFNPGPVHRREAPHRFGRLGTGLAAADK